MGSVLKVAAAIYNWVESRLDKKFVDGHTHTKENREAIFSMWLHAVSIIRISVTIYSSQTLQSHVQVYMYTELSIFNYVPLLGQVQKLLRR